MAIDKFLGAAFAASFGAIIGSLLTTSLNSSRMGTNAAIQTRDLTILDEHSRPAARLTSLAGKTVLRFYSAQSTPALEVGVEQNGSSRFVRFFANNGRMVAALNSVAPNGESTLYLGDERWATRVIIGAMLTDLDPQRDAASDNWGLEFRKPGSNENLFNVLVRSSPTSARVTAALRLMQSDGRLWTVY